MGGIVGKLSFDPEVRIARPTVARMVDAIAHRGAHAGTWAGRGVVFAWRDGEPAPQAGRNETGCIRVAADAELSNGVALRRQLERLGHVFDGASDAEVMAHAYEEWGDACVARFSGPFACAIWDDGARRLLLARDHLGIRPLCYALLHGDGVVFGSEIKALLQDPAVSRECSPEAIDTYLALGYVPSPLTIYRRVSKLEAAHTLVVEGRRLTTRQFWEFAFAGESARTEEETLDLLEGRLRAAIAEQAREPETGVLTSGGVASAAIAACTPRGHAAVGVAAEQSPADLVRIAEMARQLGLRGQLDLTTPDAADVARLLASHFDEPMADPAAVTQYSVFAAARLRMRVALTGHGGAALWAGYRRHRIEQIESEMRSMLPGPLARLGGALGRGLKSVRGAHTLAHLALPPAGACAAKHAYGLFDEGCRHEIYTRGFSLQVRDADPFARHVDVYRRCPSPDPLVRALYVEARTCLPDSRLTIAERAATAAGLRLRHPLLDRGLAELTASLPTRLKMHGGTSMYALRRVAGRYLPSALLPPERRPPAPRGWLDDALAALVPATLLHARFDNRGIFSRPALNALWAEHRSGRRNHAHRLWAVVMLEFWFREFIDGDAAAHPPEYALLVRAA